MSQVDCFEGISFSVIRIASEVWILLEQSSCDSQSKYLLYFPEQD